MNYKIIKEETVFDDFFKIKKAKIEHDLFNSNVIEVDRLSFERGDSVAILIYEKDTDSLLFTNQFRYPTIKENNGWIIELTAGTLETDEEPEKRVKKEVEEEIGYQVKELEFINSFFVSPGGSSERIFLYYSEVNAADKVFKGGGMKYEKEDIQLIKIKTKEVIEALNNNLFRDAKTLIGVQWFLANKKNEYKFENF
ncbi:ADP-ribose pyrophosphatase [Patiriisocius marinistellae]|uniref:GDP-mannose pyrophosphatase n=1 Tax=Patiriisocius marinistellae TaxID=2494560 RepID=A0A5J4G209_9FLAO|nr:NUDIX domain-containing protein [Patiriisocius marinistellae]GEQ86739.1 ADP-ribose pyrophosphatase [Patiriisocius marinistellae]